MAERLKKIKLKRRKRFFLLVFALIIILTGFFFFIKIKNSFESSHLNNLNRVNIVVFGQNIGLNVFSFEKRSGTTIVFSEDYDINSSSYKSKLAESFLLPVMNYLQDDLIAFNSQDSRKKLLSKIILRQIFNKGKTDLSDYDLLALFFKNLLLKNSEVNEKRFDSEFQISLKDSRLRQEALSLAVLNATGKTNLAQRTAKMLENSGLRVVWVADSTEEGEEKCLIKVIKEKEGSYTVFWLKSVLGCELTRVEEMVNRAEVTLILKKNNGN